MAPLYLTTKIGDEELPVTEVRPGKGVKWMSNTQPDGTNEIIVFKCRGDDSQSDIYSLGQNVVAPDNQSVLEIIKNTKDAKILGILREGTPALVLNVKNDGSPFETIVTFTHRSSHN